MKFGVQASQANMEWKELLALWQELDRDSNFDSLWLVDHFVPGWGTAMGAEGPHLEGWTALAALAMATRRVRIGVLVSGNTYRHPAVLAKMATTVDHLSGGRLNFGIGAAWHQFEHRAYGIPFPSVRERLDRLEEAVQLIKLLWTPTRSGPATFKGSYYQLDEAPYSPPNVQQPHPPILVGGGGEKRTLRIAAQYANAMNVFGSPEMVSHKIEVLRQHCREVGRDPAEIKITITILLFLTEDPTFRQRVLQGVASAQGVDEEEARRRILVGSIQEVKEAVAAFAAVGVEEMYLQQFPRLHQESLLRFSEEVIPAFR